MLRITTHFLERYAERRGLDKGEARRQIMREFGKTKELPRKKAQRLLGPSALRHWVNRYSHYRTDGVGVWVMDLSDGGQVAVTYLTPNARETSDMAPEVAQ